MFGHILLNLLLAVVWCFLVMDFSGPAFLVGYLLGAGTLFVSRRLLGESVLFRKLGLVLRLGTVFSRELVVANLQVAWWILRPRLRLQPALIYLPISLETDTGIATLAGMISLTPGTLTVDVAPDRKSLVIHCLHAPDVAATKQAIKLMFEEPLRELER